MPPWTAPTIQITTDVSQSMIGQKLPHVLLATDVTHRSSDALGAKELPKPLAKDAFDLDRFVSMVNRSGRVDHEKNLHNLTRDLLHHR